MTRERSRPWRRLFYGCMAALLLTLAAAGQNWLTLTQISDQILRADGSAAGGAVLIWWPAFVTADGKSIAAGSTTVGIGPNGTFNVQLAPNAGATPAGVLYKVVLKLDEAVSAREIVDEGKFKDGLGKIIDGTVQCLNASVWAK